jgi:hypothetical protein
VNRSTWLFISIGRIPDPASECLVALENGVTFRYKDYRRDVPERQQVMTLTANEFLRRYLLHALPKGFRRIRHYGLLASCARKTGLERVRQLLAVTPRAAADRPIHRTHARRVLAVEAAWSSSRSLNAGVRPAHHDQLRHRPGGAPRDPARPDLALSRSRCALETNLLDRMANATTLSVPERPH